MHTLLHNLFSDINRAQYFTLGYKQVDRVMVGILWWHAAMVSAFALIVYFLAPAASYPSPVSWRVLSLEEAIWICGLALLAALLPTLLLDRVRNHYVYRLITTSCLFIFSYLIVFASGGSIEGHFHFFVVFLLLVLYYDWRLGWLGFVLVAAHHGILNYIRPDWVYFYGRNDVSVLAHALPVLILVIVTTWISKSGRDSISLAAQKNKELEQQLRAKIPGLSPAETV